MKTRITTFIFYFLLFCCITVSFSQEDDQDQFATLFSNKQNSLNVLSSISATQLQNIPLVSVENSIFIQQVGSNNNVQASVTSSNSDIMVNQFGNDNVVLLDKSAREINQFILQDGNNNAVIDINLNNATSINSNFTQNGNNLNILSIGSNSISQDLTVKQTGNSGSIIILNK